MSLMLLLASCDRAISAYDQPHRFVLNTTYELPFGRGKAFGSNWNRVAEGVLGGWQVNGIMTFRSGRPVNICLPNDNAGLGDGDICERPDIIANPILDRSKRTINEYFNVDAFATPALGTFGNGGRNPVRGAGINNWDLSIFKDFTIPWFGRHQGWLADENATLQFRTEFFNAWNHTQFSSINTVFQTQGAGMPSGSSTGFGQVSAAHDPREIQFALKLLF